MLSRDSICNHDFCNNSPLVFNQNIIEDPKIKWFVLNVDEDEFRRKQKGINSGYKSPKKYTGIIPTQESIIVPDMSPERAKPSVTVTARHTIELESEEENTMHLGYNKPQVF